MIHSHLTLVETMKLLGLDPDFRGSCYYLAVATMIISYVLVLLLKWLGIVIQQDIV